MSTATGQYIIEVSGTGDAESVIRRVAKAEKSVGKEIFKNTGLMKKQAASARKVQQAWQGTAMKVAGITAGLYAAKRAAAAMVKAVEEGSRARTMGRLIDSIKGGADAVAALSAGLNHTVDTTTLQGFVQLGSQIGMTAEQMRLAGGYATSYSQTMGKDLLPTLRSVFQAFATGRAASFRSLGINAKDTEDAYRQMALIVEQTGTEIADSMTTRIGQVKASYANAISDLNELIAESAVLIFLGEESFARMYDPKIVGLTNELNDALTDVNIAIMNQKTAVEDAENTILHYDEVAVVLAKRRLADLYDTEKALWAQVKAVKEFEKIARGGGVEAAWANVFDKLGASADNATTRFLTTAAVAAGLYDLMLAIKFAKPIDTSRFSLPDGKDLIEGFDNYGNKRSTASGGGYKPPVDAKGAREEAIRSFLDREAIERAAAAEMSEARKAIAAFKRHIEDYKDDLDALVDATDGGLLKMEDRYKEFAESIRTYLGSFKGLMSNLVKDLQPAYDAMFSLTRTSAYTTYGPQHISAQDRYDEYAKRSVSATHRMKGYLKDLPGGISEQILAEIKEQTQAKLDAYYTELRVAIKQDFAEKFMQAQGAMMADEAQAAGDMITRGLMIRQMYADTGKDVPGTGLDMMEQAVAMLDKFIDRKDGVEALANAFRNLGSEMSMAMSGTTGGSMDPEAASLLMAMSNIAEGSRKAMEASTNTEAALTATNGVIAAGKTVTAAFIDDYETRAAVMAAWEFALGFSTIYTAPWESAAHFVAAGLFAAMAGGAWKSASSSTSTGSASSYTPTDLTRPSDSSSTGGDTYIIVGGDVVAGDEAAGSWVAGMLNAHARNGGHLDPRLSRIR